MVPAQAMRLLPLLAVLAAQLSLVLAVDAGSCAVAAPLTFDYSSVLSASRDRGIEFKDLPGYTRSVYERDHALVTPESRVWAKLAGWQNAVTAHLISPAVGANFAMYMAKMSAGGSAAPAAPNVERFVFALEGAVEVKDGGKALASLAANGYAYLPPNGTVTLASADGAGLLVFERRYALQGKPEFHHGDADASPLLDAPGEVFLLRKLLPQTEAYDFNVHVMDFKAGDYLNIKEVHYNQHGLLLLAGQGIYRLADKWYPVQAGDAIWMAPYVPQWYAALAPGPSRYILYKDTTLDPLA